MAQERGFIFSSGRDLQLVTTCCTELLGLFWTLSIVCYIEDKNHNVSETGSVSILRWMGQDKPTQLGPLERASLNHYNQLLPTAHLFLFVSRKVFSGII
jgi:hypothetical protein